MKHLVLTDLDTLAICTGGFIGVIGALLIPKGERSEEVAGLGASQPLHLARSC